MSLPEGQLDPDGDPYCWECRCYHAEGDPSYGCYAILHDQYLDQGEKEEDDR